MTCDVVEIMEFFYSLKVKGCECKGWETLPGSLHLEDGFRENWDRNFCTCPREYIALRSKALRSDSPELLTSPFKPILIKVCHVKIVIEITMCSDFWHY